MTRAGSLLVCKPGWNSRNVDQPESGLQVFLDLVLRQLDLVILPANYEETWGHSAWPAGAATLD